MENDNKYFAAKDATDTAAVLEAKVDEWSNSLDSNGFLEKLRSCYLAYHGAYYDTTSSGHQISFSGEQGELVNFPVNQYRNIATHMLVMTTANRPTMECRATNTDYKSQRQTLLANNILDYYMREKKLENYLKQAAEYAIVYGAGHIVMSWNATRGEMVDYIEETKTKIYEGDIDFEALSPFDVIYDSSKENNNHDWVMIRRWKNKYDLAEKYPEFAEKIKGLATKSDLQKFRIGVSNILDTTDDVQVMEFFHNRTDSVPDGRYMMFLTSDIVLEDTALPYRVLPVFRIAPANIHGTPYGYTPMFDLLPLQEELNSLYSTVATNQNAFGVQNVLNPRGTDISVNQLVGGLNVLDYNAQAGEPKPLNLTQTSPETFKFIEIIEHAMETISGINSVARGNPESSLKSGTALALVQSMALQFISGLQQSYVELIESVGSALIKILQDFAHTPRLIAIAGKKNRNYMKEFSSEDIKHISRVIVDIGNPLSRTTAGRVQMAQELIQYGEITPKQYVSVIETGSLDEVTEDIVDENLLMRHENELIMDGEKPILTITDSHKDHIDYHRSILFDPDLRKDPLLVQLVTEHIQEHINALRTTDPALLQLLNQQPLPPLPVPGAMPPPPGPQGGPPPMPGGAPDQMMPPPPGLTGPQIEGGSITGPGLPNAQNIPNLPKVPANLLENPELQQQSMGNVKM
jgi:hypothetical protein